MVFGSLGCLSRNARWKRPVRRSGRISVRESVRVSRRSLAETLEARQLLAGLIGIQPNDGELLEDGQVLNLAPTELTFRFDETPPALTEDSLVGNIRIRRSGFDGIFGNANDVTISPGFMGLGDDANTAIVRFAETLPDDVYRIDAFSQALHFELDLGAQVVAVVPQPVTRVDGELTQARDQIVVYFNNDDLDPTSAEDPRYYQLIFTNDTAANTDDGPAHFPISVDYDSQGDRATLTFARPLDELSSGPGTYRLRIGTDEAAPLPPLTVSPKDDAGSSFTTAYELGPLGRSQMISGQIVDDESYPLDFPGGNDEPGHRDLPLESDNQHVPDTVLPDGTRVESKDTEANVATIGYVFRSTYGSDPFGVPLTNLISEEQKQRTREIFDLYGSYIGAQFFEVDETTLPDLVGSDVQFFSIATGDMRAVAPLRGDGPGGQQGIAGAVVDPVLGVVPTAVVDAADRLDDGYGGSWFDVMLGLVTYLLGTSYAEDLPPGTAGSNQLIAGYTPEPVFPSSNDIAHVQHLYRPEGRDIDLYRFELAEPGLFTAETMAERQHDVSMLDTVLNLYREDEAGNRTLVGRNDDYIGNESFIELSLHPGTYYIGVSASGNNDYDPVIEDSGIGGRTTGDYQLRLDFRPEVHDSLVDATGVPFDGNNDGVAGGVYNYWLRAQSVENTLIVDKSAPGDGTGSLSAPYSNLAVALSAANPGDIVRVIGNGGADRDLNTVEDNLAYQIGFDSLSRPLADGSTLEVPQSVTVMVDAGAIFKLRRARVGVGSSTPRVDRSGSALQVLGTPDHQVIFTSINDESVGGDTTAPPTTPRAGDWGGLIFRQDVDMDEGRFVYEEQAIFLDYVNHADLRYGGGEVVIESIQQTVTPIQMTKARPTVTQSVISQSADAAMSADPDSFEETNFHAPADQQVPFTSDYVRVGPDIHGNTLLDNTINGLFIKIATPTGGGLQSMTVSGRWDDRDIVHVVTENLVVQGNPGGPLQDSSRAPDVDDLVVFPVDGGFLNTGDYRYRFTYLLADGSETTPSASTLPVSVLGRRVQGTIVLDDLPLTFQDVESRRIYRSTSSGDGPYRLIAETDLSLDTFVDDGTIVGTAILDEQNLDLKSRPNARLTIDPGTVVKLSGAHIDVARGGDFYAEGRDGFEVVFTSLLDDRYGAGNNFDTRNDAARSQPNPGDWGGITASAGSNLSIDFGTIAFGGGITKVQGSFTGINAIEIHQATGRVTHTTFSDNADGTGGQAPRDRFGRGFNASGTIFVRGAEPIIVENVIRDGLGPAININPGALSSRLVVDHGSAVGETDRITEYGDNQGALIRGNRIGGNAVNGMVVRGELILNESVWDDTDIVHVVFEEIEVPNFHTEGGLRLESSATASLVVKFDGEQAGLTAGGTPYDFDDRIGGRVQIVGQPGFSAVLTSIRDDSIGAGFGPDGRVQNDTDGNGDRLDPGGSLPTGPEVNLRTLIDNDVLTSSPGAFAAQPTAGGDASASSVTVQSQNAILLNQDFIGQFLNYVDVGRDGQAVNLANTNITLPPTLIANDAVASEGNFVVGQTVEDQQTIEWRVETSFENGNPTLFNKVTFSSDEPLGSIRLINMFDGDILGNGGDLLLPRGEIGTSDFRAFTLDDQHRIGFGHGGILEKGPDFQNSTFAGWSSDLAADLTADILGPGGAYSVGGNIDQIDLLQDDDPDLGQVYGPADVGTAFAWDVNASATEATMTSFLELVGRNPSSLAGDWRGIVLDEYSNDRNVDVATEREPTDAEAPGINGIPSTAQFLGDLAPHLKAGDDSQRLGFEVHGFLNSTRDVDVYSFRAQGGTEVWLDIDRTTSSLDSVVELVDANGVVVARSDNSYHEQVGLQSVFGPANSLKRSVFLPNDLFTTNIHDAGMRLSLPGASGVVSTYHVRVRSSGKDVANVSGGLTRGAYQLQIRLQELDEIPGSTVQYADIRNALNGIEILGQPAKSPLLGEVTEVPTLDNQTRDSAQNIGNVLRSTSGGVTLVGSMSDLNDIDWYEFDVVFEDVVRNTAPFYAAFTIDVDYTDGLARPNTTIYLFNDAGQLIYSSDGSSVPDDQFAPTGVTALQDLSTGSGGGRDPFLGTVLLEEGTYSMAIVSSSHSLDALDDEAIRGEPVNSLVRIAEERVSFTGGSEIPVEPVVPVLFAEEYGLIAPRGSEIVDGESFTVTDLDGLSVTYEFDNDGEVRGLNVPIPFDAAPVGDNLLYSIYGFDSQFSPGDSELDIASKIRSAISANGPPGVSVGSGFGFVTVSSVGSIGLEGVRGVSLHPAPGESDPSLYVSKPAEVPFLLSDVTMFATVDSGLDQSRLITIDPYTGGTENIVGTFPANVEGISIKPNGDIHGFSVTEQNPEPDNLGNYILIDEASVETQALGASLGDDGIQTFQRDPANPDNAMNADDGVLFQGIAFGDYGDRLRGFAIGNRGMLNPFGVVGPTTNLLYEFDVETGAAFSIAPPDPPDREEEERLQGGGTQIRERGQLDTTVDPVGLGDSTLIVVEATEIDVAGNVISRIVDGMQFAVDDGSGVMLNFEFNSGPEVIYTYLPAAGIFVRDGDTFLLDDDAYEFDTGSVIVVEALNGNGIADGQTLSITDNQVPSVTRVFEFDDGTGGTLPGGSVAIPFSSSMDQAGIADAIIQSINAVGNFNIEASLLANSNRISMRGESPTVGARSTAANVSIQGSPSGVANLIGVEENMTAEDFGRSVANAVPGAGADGNRLNFSGVLNGSFPNIINRGVFTPNPAADGFVTPGFIGVSFEAWDTAADIAGRIADTVNAQSGVNAVASVGATNLLGEASFDSADEPLRVGGTAPGGNFTGIAIIDSVIYGVTGPDRFGQGGGGLYRILYPSTNNAVADYVETSQELLTGGRDQFGQPTGGPILFSSLTPGPDDAEDGRYAETLFGLDIHGNMYAMDLQGNLLPIFMNSETSVQIKNQFGFPAFSDVTGITFSTLDVNLWHVTQERREDDGHGVQLAPDGSRREELDANNLSLRFGFDEPGRTPGNWSGQQDPGIRDSYDFPGGAHGSITSNTFSLKDYDESDGPALYFNYFLDTEQAEGDRIPPPFMRDSFRVFISTDDGEWQLVATNNSFRGDLIGDDEFDYGPFDPVELQDNVGWRQARIDLSPYGGEDNVRLRFDFNSAGGYDIGEVFTGGEELRAIDGSRLLDGDAFWLQDFVDFGINSFEFDMGFTLVAASGSGLVDGQAITLSDGVNAPVTIEADLGDGVSEGNIPLLFHNGMSPAEVARVLELSVLTGFGKGYSSVDLRREQNDTISQPLTSELTEGTIIATGTIGDNSQLFGPQAGRDVDMLQIEAKAGQMIVVDVDTIESSSTRLSDSQLRVFNDEGDVIAENDNGSASNESEFSFDSYLEFVAPESGDYFIGVSGGGNDVYNPFAQGSGLSGATGDYRLEVTLSGMESDVVTHLNGARLNLDGVISAVTADAMEIVIDGAPGTSLGSFPVVVHPNMSDDEVAWSIRGAIATAFGSGDPAGIPGFGDVIRLYGHQVIDPGPLGLSVTGFPLTNLPSNFEDLGWDPDFDFNGLDGDTFGAFGASTQLDGATNGDFPGFLRGQANDFEGAYIDDIVIGFSERGTMYTNAPSIDTFTRIPTEDLPAEEIYTGDYQVELRGSAFYGVAVTPPLPTLVLTEAFEPTQRLAPSVTLSAPAGANATDGMIFTVGDGTDEVVLEYDHPNLRNGVVSGHVPVSVDATFLPAQVANAIRDVINSPAVQQAVDLRAESRTDSSYIELFGNPVVDTGRQDVAEGITESNDLLSQANETTIRPGGRRQFLGQGFIGDNPVIGAGLDVDLLRVELGMGDHISVDVDSVDVPFDSVLRLFNADGVQLAFSDDDRAPGEPVTLGSTISRDPYLSFTAIESGAYYIGVSGYSNLSYDPTTIASGTSGNVGEYLIGVTVGPTQDAVQVIIDDDGFGDTNARREQGQIVIHSNNIRNSAGYGVRIDAGDRDGEGNIAHQGPPRLLFEENDLRLAPGVAVKNNVIAFNRDGAILYSGDARPADMPDSAVPFGRIVNNTLVGGRPSEVPELLENKPLGNGITLEENVSATILNNIIANFVSGILVDDTSINNEVVVGGNLYQTNRADSNVGLGDFAISLSESAPLFVDRDSGNFNLAPNSPAIDSSVDSLTDRQTLIEITSSLGIEVSPILAPEFDVTGQLRVDDPTVETPSGLSVGSNVFKDRGAVDRADFVGPTALLLNPRDNDSEGGDLNPAEGIVQINDPVILSFDIQLNDGVTETGRQSGTGIDASSVNRDTVVVMQDDVPLQEGVDYIFSYATTSRIIRLTPLTGVWEPGRVYVIDLDNSAQGIRDLADNQLAENEVSGRTRFTIAIGGEEQDFGDAPQPYPTLLLDNGPSHVIDSGFFLGDRVDVEPNGIPSADASGDGADEDGITFLDPLVPGTTARIQVETSERGRVDAWFDFNVDGDWTDPGEQVMTSFVADGIAIVNVSIPTTTPTGVSFARFRLSRDGGLSPNGIALNGEVEDYQVRFIDEKPWHNVSTPTDVNDDGFVIPLDALLVINELNNRVVSHSVTGLLPNPPEVSNLPENTGFFDVDGDGYASPLDALLVINQLNASLTAEGEAAAVSAVPTKGVVLDIVDGEENRSVLIASALHVNDSGVQAADDALSASLVDDALSGGDEEIMPSLLSHRESHSRVFEAWRSDNIDDDLDDFLTDELASLKNDGEGV